MTGVLTSHSGLGHDARAYIRAGRGLVVDAGGRGDYTSIQDAVDFFAARESAGFGGGHIWIRNGTYYEAVVQSTAHNRLVIQGESWDSIIDGGTMGHAFQGQGDVTLKNLQFKTLGGGGNAYDAVELSSANQNQHIENCLCLDADQNAFRWTSSNVHAIGCHVNGVDAAGFSIHGAWSKVTACHSNSNGSNGFGIDSASGDGSIVTCCQAASNGTYGVRIAAADENCVVGDNRATANSTANVSDASGTSTVTGNDTT